VKILHLSEGGLPDTRVERAALAAVKKGYEVIFAGGRQATGQIFNIFHKIYYRPWSTVEKLGFPYLMTGLRKWLRRILRREEPSFIHAHNIFAAKLALDVGYPFVYDDHENWGVRADFEESKKMRGRPLPLRLTRWCAVRSWKRWERQVLRAAPCITVSSVVAKFYRRIQPYTFVIPNVPNRQEVAMIPPNRDIDSEFRIAYISGLGREKQILTPHWPWLRLLPGRRGSRGGSSGRIRDEAGGALERRPDAAALLVWRNHRLGAKLVFVGHPVLKLEEVENHGYVSHREMLSIIATCDASLMGKRILFPFYSFQNAFTLSLHAGLKTLVHRTQLDQSRFCQEHGVGWTWSTGEDLKKLIKRLTRTYFADVEAWNREKRRVRQLASRLLVWENYEDQLIQAYEAALSAN